MNLAGDTNFEKYFDNLQTIKENTQSNYIEITKITYKNKSHNKTVKDPTRKLYIESKNKNFNISEKFGKIGNFAKLLFSIYFI